MEFPGRGGARTSGPESRSLSRPARGWRGPSWAGGRGSHPGTRRAPRRLRPRKPGRSPLLPTLTAFRGAALSGQSSWQNPRRHFDEESDPRLLSAATHSPKQHPGRRAPAAPPPPTGFQTLAPKAGSRDTWRDDAMTRHATCAPPGSQARAGPPPPLPFMAKANHCLSTWECTQRYSSEPSE